ncbi:MAG TPA: hypothetical protein VGA51_13930 [Casimicrobiaceae bacterium]
MSRPLIRARTAPLKRRDKLNQLPKRPGVIKGDPAKLAEVPTFDGTAWRKKWDKRLNKTPKGHEADAQIKKAKAEGKKNEQKGPF